MAISIGFPPVERGDAHTLILGSLPGRRSIAEQQYYAHPQNAFWRIMAELYAIDGDYAASCRQLTENRVALWDVLTSSFRPGSMDADISLEQAQPNDFAGFFETHPSIRLIAFNGRTAQQLFQRLVVPANVADGIRCVTLPSTSPAYASMPLSVKLAKWREALLGNLD